MRKTKTVQKVPFLAPDVETKVIPAPTDGWDAISPLAEMDAKRAVNLINWVPRPGYVEVRGGYDPFNSIPGGNAVETLMVWRGPSTQKMFAAAGTAIYDVSVGGIQTSVVPGVASARFQYTNFVVGNGDSYIQCVNGTDTLKMYDGTTNTWSVPSITGLPGGTTANIINIYAQKRRLWYIMSNSTVAAYMPTDTITGPIASTLDFGALWSKGGFLVAMTSWTIDGGAGPQDYACFISSRGQITVYQGTDPTNVNAWSLVGTFDVSPPIGRRCFTRVGSDVMIITQQGVIPISQALPFDPSADRSIAVTARIQNAMAQAFATGGTNFGWQFITYPAQTLALLNVPLVENNSQVQFVMNTLTGAWCQFNGWNANCFELFGDNLYWGGNAGGINLAYVGTSDNGASVACDLQCAWNWLDEPGKEKRITMIQPLLVLGGALTPTLAIDTDFLTSTAVAPVSTLQGGAVWDSAIWDTALWPGLSVNYTSWLSISAIGHAFAVHLRVNLNAPSITFTGAFDVGVFDQAVFDGGETTLLPNLKVNAFNIIVETGGAI